ncbi:Ammonium transporter 2 [Abeliophyllum distichum]|uniref:Ammonium transporter 2 n=1 Tax=Abeliophyllum distichum TaxID=126358 RepID=A0ABD1V699_9LAMI
MTLSEFSTRTLLPSTSKAFSSVFLPSNSSLPSSCPSPTRVRVVHGRVGGIQLLKQILGGGFIIGWNIVVTSIICVVIRFIILLRMSEKELEIGDDAVYGKEASALWGDGEKYDSVKHGFSSDDQTLHHKASTGATQVV